MKCLLCENEAKNNLSPTTLDPHPLFWNFKQKPLAIKTPLICNSLYFLKQLNIPIDSLNVMTFLVAKKHSSTYQITRNHKNCIFNWWDYLDLQNGFWGLIKTKTIAKSIFKSRFWMFLWRGFRVFDSTKC